MVLPVAAMLLPLLLSRVAKHHSVAADSNDCFLHATATIFLLLAWLLRLAPVGYCGWPQLAIAAGRLIIACHLHCSLHLFQHH